MMSKYVSKQLLKESINIVDKEHGLSLNNLIKTVPYLCTEISIKPHGDRQTKGRLAKLTMLL